MWTKSVLVVGLLLTIGASEGAPDKGESSESGAHYRPNPNHENGKEQRSSIICNWCMNVPYKLGCVDVKSRNPALYIQVRHKVE